MSMIYPVQSVRKVFPKLEPPNRAKVGVQKVKQLMTFPMAIHLGRTEPLIMVQGHSTPSDTLDCWLLE